MAPYWQIILLKRITGQTNQCFSGTSIKNSQRFRVFCFEKNTIIKKTDEYKKWYAKNRRPITRPQKSFQYLATLFDKLCQICYLPVGFLWIFFLIPIMSWFFDGYLKEGFMVTFKVGEDAVYPGHGVGRILAIETKEILGNKQTFYSVQIIETGMKIMIPMDNVRSVGLRPIISRDEAGKVVGILKEREVRIDNQTWNRRYREYMEKIKTGSVYEIAEVLRDLFVLKVDKELSFGERKMLDTARTLLFKELSIATKGDDLFKEQELKDIFGLDQA